MLDHRRHFTNQRLLGLIAGIFCVASASQIHAQTTNLDPEIQGSTNHTKTESSPGLAVGGIPGVAETVRFRWGTSSADNLWYGWLQFKIPVPPEVVVDSAILKFTGISDEISNPGLSIGIVDNDWDEYTIYQDRYIPEETIAVFGIYDFPEDGAASVDITSWFDGTVASIQPGETLSIRGEFTGGGHRRAFTDQVVQLELTFDPKP